jgi:tape measure domain-containing protein
MAYTASQGAVISVSVDGAAASQRQIEGIAQSMTNLSATVQNAMRNVAATAGIGGGLVQIVQLSDEYTKLTSQLRLATDSTASYASAYADVKRISSEAQSELAGTGVLYAKIAKGTKELGIGQKAVADITEVVSLSLKVSAASGEEAASAQLQLAQAFASGALRGEEFNAVNEAAPRLMQALAEGMGVPIGALKQMASEGLITSEVMAQVLPKSLEQLRQEATQVQTISGAFQVLKNNVLEFTATNAQANGSVAAVTGAINLLANNLTLLTGALTTVTAVKTVNWLAAWTTETYKKIAADQASRTAAVAAAQADLARVQASGAQAAATQAGVVVAREEMVARLSQANANILAAKAAIQAATAAGAQSFALQTLRGATAELAAAEQARSVALAELAVLGQQAARVSAEIAAAQTAEAVAARSVAAAQTAAGVGAGLASRAIGMLGGPIGAIVTVLGIAATAWSWYASSSEDANRRVTESTEETDAQVIDNLEKQTQKLRERAAMAKQGGFQLEVAKDGGPAAERLANYLKQINELKAQGNQLSAVDQVQLINLQGLYAELLRSVAGYKAAKAELDATGSAAKDVIEIRERLTGVNKQYLEDLGKLQTAREKGAVTEKEYKELLTMLATETYKNSDAGKEATAAANKAKEAYSGLISSIREKIDSNRLEVAVGENATESQKALIKLDQETAAGKLKLSAAQMASARAAIAEMGVTEQALKKRDAERDVAKYIMSSSQARNASLASLQAEYATYGQSADARDLAMVKVRAEADMERKLAELREAKKPVTDEMIAQLQAETAERVRVEQATLAQSKALGYATQLAQENKRTAAEAISDPRKREQALVEIDADVWRERIRLAGDGTQAQKDLQQEFDTWYANRKKVSSSNIDLTQASALLDIMSAVDDAAKSAAQGMEASFGRVGASIGKLTTTLSGFQRTEAAIAAQRAASIKDAGGDQEKIQRANQTAAEASAQAQIKSYGDMASAAKGFFDENSTGYKVLGGIEKAYRAAEMAMALQSMAKKIFFKETEVAANTTLNATKLAGEATASAASTGLAATEASAWGVTAVVKAIASLPFPLNLAAGAATLAAVVAIGAKIAGGLGGSSVSLSQQRQQSQGTGSVLGDSDAKSESIKKSIDAIEHNTYQDLAISSSMLATLRSIDSNISSFASQLVRTTDITNPNVGTLNTNNGFATTALAAVTGGAIGLTLTKLIPGLGNVVGKIATSIFGGKQSVEDSGFSMDPTRLASILSGGAHAYQYADIKTSGGWFSSDKHSTKTTQFDDAANRQFTAIIGSLADSVTAAGDMLGLSCTDFTDRLNGFVVDIGKVSLKDLKGDELQKEIESIFSKLGDDLAQYAVGGLEQLQQVGEGYLQTLVRIATEYQTVDVVFQSFGKTFGQVGMESVAARDRLVQLAGGLDEFTSQAEYFLTNFFSDKEQAAALRARIDPTLAQYGLSSTGENADKMFRDFIVGLDTTTKEGAQAYTVLMGIAPALKQVIDAEKDALEERRGLQDQLDELTMTSTQLLAKQRAALDESNRSLFDQVQAIKAAKDSVSTLLGGVDDAFSVLQKVADREKAAVQVTIDAHAAAVTRLQGLSQALHGALDGMKSAEQKLFERATAQAEIRADLAITKAGGTLSDPQIESLKKALSAVAQDSSEQFSSSQDYLRDLYQTQNDIGQLAGLTDASLSVEQQALEAAQKQLKALEDMLASQQASVDELKGVNTNGLTLVQAMQGLTSAILTAKASPVVAATSAINGAYQQYLGRAPDSTGFQFWQNAAATGTPVSQIVSGISGSTEAELNRLYQSVYNRAPDAQGLQFWMSAYGAQMDAAEKADFLNVAKNTDEYKKLHPFAIGTNYVPEDMPALIHRGERIIPAADNRELMSRLSSPSDSNAELVAEMRLLKAELEKIRESSQTTASSTTRHADQFDQVTAGGNAMLTEAA